VTAPDDGCQPLTAQPGDERGGIRAAVLAGHGCTLLATYVACGTGAAGFRACPWCWLTTALAHHSANEPSGWRHTGPRQSGAEPSAARTARSSTSMPRP